jgi:hypothetical protein
MSATRVRDRRPGQAARSWRKVALRQSQDGQQPAHVAEPAENGDVSRGDIRDLERRIASDLIARARDPHRSGDRQRRGDQKADHRGHRGTVPAPRFQPDSVDAQARERGTTTFRVGRTPGGSLSVQVRE